MGRIIHHMAGAAMAVLVASGPLYAQDSVPRNNPQAEAEKALRDGMETILRALNHMLGSLPQYEMPEVLDNGDIIIRRKPREPERKPKDGNKPSNGGSST